MAFRRATVCTVVATATLVLLFPVNASARIPRYYRATIAPADVAPGSVTAFVLRITEGEGSKGSIGSADIFVPSGFSITAPGTVATFDAGGVPTAKTWTSSLDMGGSQIDLRNPGPGGAQKLQPGQYLELSFSAQVACAAGTYVWRSAVRNTNDFHNSGVNFVIAKTQPVPRVTVGSSRPS